MRKQKLFGAFTLAEVLITLGIIGVVAALTIPTLMKNYEKKVTVTKLRKAYTEFAQIIQKAQVDNGSLDTWDFADFDTALDRVTYFFENFIKPNVKVVKTCIPTSNECWPDGVQNLGGGTITGAYFTNDTNTKMSFVTAQGVSVYVWLHGNGTGMWYVVDVNGPNKPNRLGHDIFAFLANWGKTTSKMGVYPAGAHKSYTRDELMDLHGITNDHQYACRKEDHVMAGGYCGAVIMLDDWQIKNDYPW